MLRFTYHIRIYRNGKYVDIQVKRRGRIGLSHMGMRTRTDDLQKEGLTIVYPNYRHENRKGGLTGFSALSPMKLGPIKANNIVYKTLESFHQFNKVYANEYDGKKVTTSFYKQRDVGANQPPGQVYRHKYGKTKVEHIKNLKKIIPKGPFTPLFSYHEGKKYDYYNSRFFYCHYYEILAHKTKEYKRLLNYVKKGNGINICGYDAPDIDNVTYKFIYEAFKNTKKPFGHELVLAAMLLQDIYGFIPPWKKFKVQSL